MSALTALPNGPVVVGSLLSVNVGMPRERAFPGGPIASGIDKRPIVGRRMVRRLNIDGDGQGDLKGHGGEQRAVLVYDGSNYAYWVSRYPQLEGAAHGSFGENFTAQGLTDDAVCIGDRYAIGAAQFEVTQPRVTCFRLGAHTGVRDLPRAFVAEGRPGFYMRVLVEGEVGAGDDIVLLERGRHALSVEVVDRLLYGASRPKRLLESVLEVPALSPGWRASFVDLLEGRSVDAAGRAPTPLAWEGWRRFVVRDKHAESAVDMSLQLAPVDGNALPPYEAGQFVSVRLAQVAPQGRRIIRSWSLSDRPRGDAWRITVRRVTSPSDATPAGLASTAVHDTLRPGDELEIAAPRGEFTLKAIPPGDPLAFVTAGIGITPAMAMLEGLLANPAPLARDVWFFHSARNQVELAFTERIDAVRAIDPRLRVIIWLSRGPALTAPPGSFVSGRISAKALLEFGVPAQAHWFICGPKSFQDDVVSGLRMGAVDEPHIHVESFGSGSAPAAAPLDAALVTFARSGGAATWNAGRFASLLDLAEDAGISVQWSCRAGVCHLCQTNVLDGEVAYITAPPDPPSGGAALLCCSVPKSDLILDC